MYVYTRSILLILFLCQVFTTCGKCSHADIPERQKSQLRQKCKWKTNNTYLSLQRPNVKTKTKCEHSAQHILDKVFRCYFSSVFSPVIDKSTLNNSASSAAYVLSLASSRPHEAPYYQTMGPSELCLNMSAFCHFFFYLFTILSIVVPMRRDLSHGQ